MLSLSSAAVAKAAAAPGAAVASAQVESTDLHLHTASDDVSHLAEWARDGDAHGLPFLVVDKLAARVFMFDRGGRLLGTAPALLGLTRGDDSAPDIGKRKLSTITATERTTPAGRFEASLGHDLQQDILWIDYDAALSLHRVIVGKPTDHRLRRLASASPLDNRISYGCINVPPAFYDGVIVPAFANTIGIVYILPETKSVAAVFPTFAERK